MTIDYENIDYTVYQWGTGCKNAEHHNLWGESLRYIKNKRVCAECTQESRKRYYQKNFEKVMESRKRYYQKNFEKVMESSKRWHQENPEKVNEVNKRYRQENPEKVNEVNKRYRQENPEKIQESNKRWHQANPEKARENSRRQRERHPITHRLRSLFAHAFRSYSKGGKVKRSKEYGIDFHAICVHLGTCPGNRDDYHIDHIIPLSLFNFDDPAQVKLAFTPKNHQWMLGVENISKGNRIDLDNLSGAADKIYRQLQKLRQLNGEFFDEPRTNVQQTRAKNNRNVLPLSQANFVSP